MLRQALLNAGNSSGTGDVLDDSDESLFGALGGESATDQLSRIVERSLARTAARAGGDGGGGNDDAAGSTPKDDKSKTSPEEECSRLYSQMREAERGELMKVSVGHIASFNNLNAE